jgi:hypothetical protein
MSAVEELEPAYPCLGWNVPQSSGNVLTIRVEYWQDEAHDFSDGVSTLRKHQ